MTRLTLLCLLAVLSAAVVGDARAGTLKVPQQHPTIQAAVDAASPGDVVKIAAGTYAETVRIFSTHSLELLADGKVTIDAAGLFGPGVQLASVTGVRLRGLRVVNATTDGFLVLGSEAIVLQDCRVKDAGGNGVRLTSGCRAVSIEGPRVRGAGLAGVQIEVASFVSVTDGHFRELGGPGVALASFTPNCVVTGNRFDTVGSPAIDADGTGHFVADNLGVGAWPSVFALRGTSNLALANDGESMVHVLGANHQALLNRTTALGAMAIAVGAAADSVIYGNRAPKHVDFGIVDTGTGTFLASNRAEQPGATGILCLDTTDTVLSANRVRKSWGTGIELAAAATGAALVGNDSTKCAGGDLHDGTGSPTHVFVGNSFDAPTGLREVPADYATIQAAVDAALPGDVIVVKKGTYGPVVIDGQHDLELRAKGKVVIDASESPGSGLVIRSSTGVVVRGLRVRSPEYGCFDVTDCRGVLLEKCVAEEAGDYGFYVFGGSRGVTLRGCRAIDSGDSGVELRTASKVHVVKCRVEGSGDAGIRTAASTSDCVFERARVDREAIDRALDVDGTNHVFDKTRVTGSPNGTPIMLRGTGHTLLRTRVAGVVKVEGARHRIVDNRVARGPVEGIFLDGADHCVVVGNRIIRPSSTGIRIREGASSNRVVGNRIVRGDGNGISVTNISHGNLLERNVVRSADGNGLVFGAGTSGNAALRNVLEKSGGVDLWDAASAGDNAWVGNAYGTASLP